MGDYDSTLGALFVGYILATALFGVMSVQTFNYFQIFERDSKSIKTTIASLWILDALQIILIGIALYHWVVSNYGNPQALRFSTVTFQVAVLVTHTIVFIVEVVFAWRVFILSHRNRILYGTIVLLACCHYGLHLATEAQSLKLVQVMFPFKVKGVAIAALSSGAAADMLIALILSYYLHAGRCGVQRTDNVINTLLLYTINTGVLTTMFAVTAMICYIIWSWNYVHFAFNIICSKLYTVSLLASLIVRRRLRLKVYRDTIDLSMLDLQFREQDTLTQPHRTSMARPSSPFGDQSEQTKLDNLRISNTV